MWQGVLPCSEPIPFNVEGDKPQPTSTSANHVYAVPDQAGYAIALLIMNGDHDLGVVQVEKWTGIASASWFLTPLR